MIKQSRRPDESCYTGDLPAVPRSVISLDRQFIDTSGDRWSINKTADCGDLILFNWCHITRLVSPDGQFETHLPARTIHLTRLYAADRLTRKAPATVDNDLDSIRLFFLVLLNQDPATSLLWAAIGESHFRNFLECTLQTPNRGNGFHRIRCLYEWGVRQGLPDFDAQVLRNIKTIRAPGNLVGQHVRSQSPTKGPLYREEIELIIEALEKGAGTSQDRIIVMLFLELGINPNQGGRLRNEDLISFQGNINGDPHTEYQIRVPRNKKRRPFRETKQRPVSWLLAELLKPVQAGEPCDPLLHWLTEGYRVKGINEALKRFVVDANIVSPRSGELLNLHARRFRYTLATEAGEQGASDYNIAELLDHSSTHHVKVYRKTEPTIADRVARALDPALASLMKRFQGEIVDSGAYPFGNIPAAPIPGAAFHLPDYPLDVGGIGWCGLDLKIYGLCEKSPPLACYTCPKFAAWRQGPHHEVLQGLENATHALNAIADKRIPQELLNTKLAVQQCIQQIEAEDLVSIPGREK